MRDYGMVHARVPFLKRLEARSTWFVNLHDLSRVWIPEITAEAGSHFTFYVRSFIFQGKDRSEFGAFFKSFSLELGMRMRL